jgi:hypothetical protein
MPVRLPEECVAAEPAGFHFYNKLVTRSSRSYV